MGDSQDENANPGNGESDEKDDSGKTDSGSSGGNADLNEDGSSSNGKKRMNRRKMSRRMKTEEEIDERKVLAKSKRCAGFWMQKRARRPVMMGKIRASVPVQS